MPQLYCYQYFKLLDNFIFVKNLVIAKILLVIIILKLKLNNNFDPGLYKRIQVYYIFLL